MTLRFGVSLVLAGAVAAAGPQAPLKSGLDVASFDQSVRPQDDLFRYVNNAWLEKTPIPPDRVSYGTFLELADRAEAELRAIIEDAAATRERQRGTARQVADLYTSLMDQERIEALGLKPIKPELDKIAAIRNGRQLAEEAGYLSSIA